MLINANHIIHEAKWAILTIAQAHLFGTLINLIFQVTKLSVTNCQHQNRLDKNPLSGALAGA